jgi:hypothetical protein
MAKWLYYTIRTIYLRHLVFGKGIAGWVEF